MSTLPEENSVKTRIERPPFDPRALRKQMSESTAQPEDAEDG